ncbi:hypothetical protein [Streptomyces sp. NPDC046805]|uniref:hypothetical protein n=1 Tax=Streptomyces sp. NPDC046805 TaxID=3155134 RepID=UPI0033C3C186
MAYTFYRNDIGVAGLSLALSAARSPLSTPVPAGSTIVITPSTQWSALCQISSGLIEQSGCGVGQEYRRWYIYGRSVRETHRLGKAVFDARAAFEALPQPSWTEGLTELLEEIADE